MSTTGVRTGQESVLAFYRPFLPLFGTIFCCLLSVGASLATLPFWVTDRLGGHGAALHRAAGAGRAHRGVQPSSTTGTT